MKNEVLPTEKPEDCEFTSSFGIDYLNLLLNRIIGQKEHSKLKAVDQIQDWRKQELTVRKCIKLAQHFGEQI
jgi:hypothetical protein